MTFFVFPCLGFAQITWDGGGDNINWSDNLNWSGDVVPISTDNVTFDNNAGNGTFIVDGNYACNNFAITSNDNITVQTTATTNTLTINGTLTLNGNTNADNILDAAAGVVNIVGAVIFGATSGSERIEIAVSTGTVTFTSAVTMPDDNLTHITFTGAGTMNFNAGFTNNRGAGEFTTFAGCTANFAGNYTQASNACIWVPTSNAIFNGGAPTITSTTAITFGNVLISGVTVTLAGGNITVANNWTNTGGALVAAGFTTTFTGTANTIDGSALSAFGPVVLPATAFY